MLMEENLSEITQTIADKEVEIEGKEEMLFDISQKIVFKKY